jgi:lactate dehydrogenase-like 2-hydroxyacid dehydrogenase
MTRVLQVGALKPALADRLATSYGAAVLPTVPVERDAFLATGGPEVEVVVTSGRFGVDRALMERLPALQAIVSFGVGYDVTDVVAARERGVAVANTPDVLTDCVADTAVGLALDTMRQLSAADRYVRRGAWPATGDYPLTRRLSGARVGILGLGRIGQAIATRLEAFGCPISYHSRRPVAGSPYSYVAGAAELADAVDLLVVATSGGSGSQHLVNRTVLEALGPDGFLVNIARGSVVDEDALVDLLTSGRLAGAGLDVFAREPHVPAALLDLESVVLLPHLASGTVETREAMLELTLANLDRWLAERTLVTPVPA